MNILVISNKRFHTDFRKYLVEAAERSGYRAAHLYCHDRFVLSFRDKEQELGPLEGNFEDTVAATKAHLGEERLVILTGMNGSRHDLADSLAKSFPNAVALYDVYDDFRYGADSDAAAGKLEDDAFWRRHTDGTIILNKNLQSTYEGSLHLDNASHVSKLSVQPWGDAAVYVGSIDRRTDFNCLRLVASAGLNVHIYGSIHPSYPQAETLLADLLVEQPRISFQGGYVNDDLPLILRRYNIGVLPYHAEHEWTRHINPDKLYHYLNAGLEVVATPIPQALTMQPYLHLVTRDATATTLRDSLAQGSKTALWPRHLYMWERRWHTLRAYAETLFEGEPTRHSDREPTLAGEDASKPAFEALPPGF